MTRYFNPTILAVLLSATLATTQGCVPLLIGAAAGAGGVVWAKGGLEQNFDKSVDQLHRASLGGLRDIKCAVSSGQIRKHLAKIKFKFDDGQEGTINIKAMTERSSRLKIRVGILGDETKSQIVLNAILKHL
ncbi:MAG TPA: hypothetical protein DE315_03185 [Candidatus Omnitrophica bacterium]|nr:hypothetical protein [Candidatus Omnitrophota bacterium]HCI44523.1 hypothetical protein [Candidatus Omnitrophota bacterium]